MISKPIFIIFLLTAICLVTISCFDTGLSSNQTLESNDYATKTPLVEEKVFRTPEAIKTPEPTPTPYPTIDPAIIDIPDNSVVAIQGEFTYTNEFYPEEYAYEHAVMLTDMTGFILRNEEWELPVDSQVLGYVKIDKTNNRASYTLQLPVRPYGVMNDVDQDAQSESGVQIFAIQYSPNWTGGPFYADDDISLGWPNYLASVVVDTENQQEVTGGKIVVWSPNSEQGFPTGFGDDGLLFTTDDPTDDLPAGYSVIDLDQQPFGIIRDNSVSISLIEPTDAAIKDFSDLSYSEAFDKMFEIISREYAFNNIPDKAPDWDSIYPDLNRRVKEAQNNQDAMAFFLALQDFALSFKDGHVSIDGGDIGSSYIRNQIIGGFGLSARELDDGKVIVVFVLEGGPAEQAGIKVGAEIIEMDDKSVTEAIKEVHSLDPESTDYGLRYNQVLLLFRKPVGTEISISYANPGEGQENVNLTAVQEIESFYATYLGGEYDEYALPIESKILNSGIGYVRINSNSDDLNLMYRLFERALRNFDNYGVLGIIIDMRRDFGGTPLGLAGYLTNNIITLGQLQYYNDQSGQFESEGIPEQFFPLDEQFRFEKMVLLVDQFCYSACELEAYGLSQVPGMVVMGQFPSAGVEAETARGKFKLPEGISFNIPTGRYILSDGSIFLEGSGVQPTIRIPVDEDSVLATEDYVLQRAIETITQ